MPTPKYATSERAGERVRWMQCDYRCIETRARGVRLFVVSWPQRWSRSALSCYYQFSDFFMRCNACYCRIVLMMIVWIHFNLDFNPPKSNSNITRRPIIFSGRSESWVAAAIEFNLLFAPSHFRQSARERLYKFLLYSLHRNDPLYWLAGPLVVVVYWQEVHDSCSSFSCLRSRPQSSLAQPVSLLHYINYTTHNWLHSGPDRTQLSTIWWSQKRYGWDMDKEEVLYRTETEKTDYILWLLMKALRRGEIGSRI